MSESQHTIAGTVLTMPVRVRKADVHTAMFSVDADAAQRLIDYSGLKVCRHRPGKAVVNLMLARYFDGDLGPYNEFATCVMVNPPGSKALGLRALGTITRSGGICSIIVEQHAQKILGLADRVVILERGTIVHDAASQALKADPTVLERYLGVAGAAK